MQVAVLVRECGCVRGCGCVSARVPRPGVRVARGVGRRDEPCVCPCACVCSARVWMAVALLLLPRYCDLAALWLVLCSESECRCGGVCGAYSREGLNQGTANGFTHQHAHQLKGGVTCCVHKLRDQLSAAGCRFISPVNENRDGL